MRAFVYASAISLALGGGWLGGGRAEAAAPRRVASLNLCTDELLLMIGAPDQIVSVTHLSRQQAESPLWRAARRYRSNDGSLVSVVGLAPDLVLTMGGGARDRARIASRLGLKVLDLPFPQTLNDIAFGIRTVAAALGRQPQGRQLLARLEQLRRSPAAAQRDTVWLGGGGRSMAADGLGAQWMQLAGMRQRPLPGDRIGLEQLLVRPPSLLLRSDYRSGQYSGEQRWLAHPLARGAARSRTLATDGRRWTCMGPAMINEIRRLRQALAR